MKYKLGGKMIADFTTLRAETFSHLTIDGDEDKKAVSTKKCVIRWKPKFGDCKHCSEEVTKIALGPSNGKRIQSTDSTKA